MRTTLLAVGDLTLDGVKKEKSVNRFVRYGKRFLGKRVRFEFLTYDDLLLGNLPGIATRRLKIMFFFPYAHWNSRVERYDSDDRVYGDEHFGRAHKRFFYRVGKILEDRYKGYEVAYVNSPAACALDRDKKMTARLLRKGGVLTPRTYRPRDVSQLNRLLEEAGALYIKPVFGAMGKGMSFVTEKECWTNFMFRRDRIVSRPYDYNWGFAQVGRRRKERFLKILIEKKFIFEEAVRPPVVRGRRFDIRIYVIYGRIPYFYARSAPQASPVTNWTQGGRIEGGAFLKKALSEKKIGQIKEIARRSARLMGLNYAGIDLILDEKLDKVYFLEAHSFPGYERGVNLMRFLIDRI